jgi:energy-coupling factor transporter ATP-binding protein EcfA2
MTTWKLGCRWGSGKPLFYDYLKEKHFVVGVWDKEYEVGDIVFLTDGFDGLGIAKITGPATAALEQPELQADFKRLQIDYEDYMFVAPARIYELPRRGALFYETQQGICRISPDNKPTLVRAIARYYQDFEKMQQLQDTVDLLKAKGQIVLYGPPGTGKTRLAKMLASELTSDAQHQKLIQFHPAYAYEDFVRGIVAETVGGTVTYRAENKILGELAEQAEADPDNNYVLIIDEINRANLPSVLGELIYALEYRGEDVESVYGLGDEKNRLLRLPKNLFFIGTMNTADRSVGHMDYAIRRRFAFVPVLPDEDEVAQGAARKLFTDVKAIFATQLSPEFKVNDVQPGHSYFMSTAEGGLSLRQKLEYELKPLLREYLNDGILMPTAESLVNKLSV